jgi:hypothetical protein
LGAGSISDKLEAWECELACDHDKEFLLDGIRCGFRITEPNSKLSPAHQKNHASALEYKNQVENELLKQIEQGHYVIANNKPAIVSALAAIPKEGGDVRIIHDGSRPAGEALNDYSRPEPEKFQTLQDASRLAKPNYFMAKVDLQSAYRSVPIHVDDYNATGLEWTFGTSNESCFLFDTRLPFGSNKGPSHFHRLSQAIRRCMVRRGFKGIVAYIDDFFIAANSYTECRYWMLELIRLIRKLGFYVSWKKVVGPTQQLTFLGVQIDTTSCTLSLDKQKLIALQQQLEQFRSRKRATKQQLQSLAGKLNWACQCVRGGRFFLRRILDIIPALKHQRHKVQLCPDFQADIHWWLAFLSVFNGIVYYSSEIEHVHVDACNQAAGVFWSGHWTYLVFEHDMPSVANLHINYKEISAVVSAVDKWAPAWRNKTVIFHTDSTVTKAAISKGWTRNRLMNSLLRKMAWICAFHNIKIRAVHVSGCINTMPDTISRLHQPGKTHILLQLLRRWHHGPVPFSRLDQHMSIRAFLFLFNRCSRTNGAITE